MTTEDKSQMLLFSPVSEKEAQKELDRLLKRLRENENGAINVNRKLNRKRTGFEDKTLWDWLQLLGILAIPLVVAGATLLFGMQQAHLADLQHQSDQEIAIQQHQSDQAIALDQQRADILQTYLGNIQDLLLNHHLYPNPDYEVKILAQAKTTAAVNKLDPKRKGIVVQFLWDSGLIGFLGTDNKSYSAILSLDTADLTYADLTYAFLKDVQFTYEDIPGVNLTSVNFTNAILIGADFTNANLTNANFSDADLTNANLTNANNLTQQQLDQVRSCKGATLPKGLTCHHNQ